MGSARRTRGIGGGLVVAVALLALVLVVASPERVGAASYSCDEAGLNNALAAGGAATFACTMPTTVTITSGKTVSANVTLDGGGKLTISGNNQFQVFYVNSGVTFGVTHLTITGGNAAVYGGGIFNNGGTTNVTNSTLSGNSAQTYGGGIFNNGGTLNITNSTLSGNSAQTYGGGIFNNNGGTTNITNSTLSSDAATYGGGIFNNSGTTNVTNSTLSGNSASNSGGGIRNNGGTASVTGSIIAGNTGGDTAGGITDNGGNLLNLATPLLAPERGTKCTNRGTRRQSLG